MATELAEKRELEHFVLERAIVPQSVAWDRVGAGWNVVPPQMGCDRLAARFAGGEPGLYGLTGGEVGRHPQAAREPKDVAEGVANAASFTKVRRAVPSIDFIDFSANIGLLI